MVMGCVITGVVISPLCSVRKKTASYKSDQTIATSLCFFFHSLAAQALPSFFSFGAGRLETQFCLYSLLLLDVVGATVVGRCVFSLLCACIGGVHGVRVL